jgi:DNA-binding response OmpR family regulator
VRRLLLIDDEPRVARALAYAVAQDQVEVVHIVGSSDLEAFDDSEAPAAILLDLALGAEDGLAVCRDLRTDPRFHDVPVLVLSGHADAATRRAAFDAGADDFIAKPFLPDELLARIDVQIQRKSRA